MTLKWNKTLILAVKDELRKEVMVQTLAVETEAKRLILSTPKTGRIYQRRGVSHQASAPGEPYASDTGQTVSKIRIETEGEGLVGKVVFAGENAKRLEFGTRKMKPRPFARPALALRQKGIKDGFAAAVKRGFAKV